MKELLRKTVVMATKSTCTTSL